MAGPRKTSKAGTEGASTSSELAMTDAAAAGQDVAGEAAAAVDPVTASEATVPPPAAPKTPSPAAPTAAPPAVAAPPAAPPPDAAPAAPAGPPPGAQVAAAISGLATDIKEKLSTAELLLGAGALLIAGLSFLIFGFLLDARSPTELPVTASILLLVLIGLERTQREGFGTWYRALLILLGAILAIGAAYSLLLTLRSGTGGMSVLSWLSMLSWWVGGLLAGVGAWMTYRVRA